MSLTSMVSFNVKLEDVSHFSSASIADFEHVFACKIIASF